MRVLFLSNIPSPYQIDFIRGLTGRDDIELFAYFLWRGRTNRKWDLDLRGDMEIAGFGYKPADYMKFYRYVKKVDPDIIFMGGYRIPLSIPAVILSKLNKKRIVLWLERPFERSGLTGVLKRLYLKIRLAMPDAIVAIGEKAQKIYNAYNDRCFNLPYSMDLERYYKIDRPPDGGDGVDFLFSGQFIERKNVINLVNAFKSLKHRNIRLTMIGSGELEDRLREEAGSDNRLQIPGFIQPSELPSVFRKSDVFVLPSRHDGWGLVVNEAMASAMPVIGTAEAGAVHEFIRHKENGYVCDTSPGSIREGLEYYINNRPLVRRHGRINRELIAKSDADVRNSVKTFSRIMGEVLLSK